MYLFLAESQKGVVQDPEEQGKKYEKSHCIPLYAKGIP
jgi:hypothetical protein